MKFLYKIKYVYFRNKKNIKVKEDKIKSKEVVVAEKLNKENAMSVGFSSSSTILKPRITEKSGDASQKLNAYTFEVKSSASKMKSLRRLRNFIKLFRLR